MSNLSIFVEPEFGRASWAVRVRIGAELFTIGRGISHDTAYALTDAQRVVTAYKTTVGAVLDSLREFEGRTLNSELLTVIGARLHSLSAILPQLGVRS